MKQYKITEISNGWLLEDDSSITCFEGEGEEQDSKVIFALAEKILPGAIIEITIPE